MEVEVKIPVADAKTVRLRILRIGARLEKKRVRESNWIFDDTKDTLRRQGQLLRLRRSGEGWILTVKGKRLPGAMKRRREVQTAVEEGRACRKLLEFLGYRVRLRYTLFRTTYRSGAGEIALDETARGSFVELEGPAGWIRSTADRLELSLQATESKSYVELLGKRV